MATSSAIIAPRLTPRMRAVVMTLPKSGTRLVTSLLNSHPDLDCRFDDPNCDVGVFHFNKLRTNWLADKRVLKIFLRRDLLKGTVSQFVGPHNQVQMQNRNLARESVQDALTRRALHSYFMERAADLVLDYEEITYGGQQISTAELPEVCAILGVRPVTFTTNLAKDRDEPTLPLNWDELKDLKP